jgi:hypothetical protein
MVVIAFPWYIMLHRVQTLHPPSHWSSPSRTPSSPLPPPSRPLASTASSPTCAITSIALPRTGDALWEPRHEARHTPSLPRSGHNGPRSGHHGLRSMVDRARTQHSSPSGVDLGHRGWGGPPGGAVCGVRGDTAHPACSGPDGCTLRCEAAVWVHARRVAGLGHCGCLSMALSSPSLPVRAAHDRLPAVGLPGPGGGTWKYPNSCCPVLDPSSYPAVSVSLD